MFEAIGLIELAVVTGGHHDHPTPRTAKPAGKTAKPDGGSLIGTCQNLDRAVNLLKTSSPDVSRGLKPLADECWKQVRGQ